MHCIIKYPAMLDEANLKVIKSLKQYLKYRQAFQTMV